MTEVMMYADVAKVKREKKRFKVLGRTILRQIDDWISDVNQIKLEVNLKRYCSCR